LGFWVFYVLLLHLLFVFLLLLLLLKLTPGVGSIVDPPTLCFLCLLLCLFVCLFSWFTLMGNVLFVSWVEGSWKFYLNRMPFRFRRERQKKQKTGATDKRVGLGWYFASMDLPFSTHRNFANRGTPI
jgi:hypothetical protein